MATFKRIIVLANSVKHNPGRCVAGREIVLDKGAPKGIGAWIRPVSVEGEGELYPRHRVMSDGGGINLLDVVDVPFVKKAVDPTQPENWIVDERSPWKRIGAWPRARLAELYENCPNLWIEPGGRKSDRVSEIFFAKHPPKQSLYLIRLANPAIVGEHRQRRLAFQHGPDHYGLKITDPLLNAAAPGAVPIAACISIAPPFKGFHYKLVASLFW